MTAALTLLTMPLAAGTARYGLHNAYFWVVRWGGVGGGGGVITPTLGGGVAHVRLRDRGRGPAASGGGWQASRHNTLNPC